MSPAAFHRSRRVHLGAHPGPGTEPPVRPRRWSRGARVAAGVLVVVVLAGLLVPVLSPWSPTATDLGAVRDGPSWSHWLGTDHLGRDELTRLLTAARTSMVAVAGVIASTVPVGVGLGLVAGWRGGWVDTVVLRATDVVTALPVLLIGLVLAAALGAGLGNVIVALAAAEWAAYARLVRTEVRLQRDQPAIQALRLLGAGPGRILLRHVLPTVLGSVLVLTSTEVATIVLLISTLTFLGLGVRPPTPEWGSMIVEARPYLATDPLLFLLPMLAIGIVVLAINIVAEGASRWVTHGETGSTRGASSGIAPAGVGPPALLSVRGLVVELTGPHGRRRVVDRVDLDLDRGRTVALVGSSGSGKTITGGVLLGLLPDGVAATAEGSVLFDGRQLLGLPDRELRRLRGRRIALVPQDLAAALDPLRRVGAQVAQAARMHRAMDRRQADVRARDLLGWVGIPDVDQVMGLRPGELSGGMRQRVLIAAALAGEPDLLVADEPTSALDGAVARQVMHVLARARDELGTGILVITHDLATVASWADTLAVLDGGRIVEVGEPARLLRDPRHAVTRALSDAARPGRGRALTASPVDRGALLRADAVTVVYPGRGRRRPRPALTQVSLGVPEGGALGLVGESGSGKSTLTRVLVGLQRPTSGTVELAGAAPQPRHGLAQLVFQDPTAALDRRQTVGAALDEAVLLAGRRGRAPLDTAQLLTRVGLGSAHADRRPWQLSGGQRQRAVIARALAARPRLLVLDEPVSSLDVVARAGVVELLRSLHAEGMALLVVSHDLSAVEELTDEVVVLHRGAVVEHGPTHCVLRSPRHPVTAALVAASRVDLPVPPPPAGSAVPAVPPTERTER